MMAEMRGPAMAEINVAGFSGADNIHDRFYSKTGVAEPRVILNADVDITGVVKARLGKTLHISLPGAHSLWAGTDCELCAANGTLYRIKDAYAVNVGAISGPKCHVSMAEAEGLTYLSNPYWQGVFNPVTDAVSSWGVPLPPGPMLLIGSGNLPAGTYNVCMTNVVNGELSGNGPISTIQLTSEGGIQVLNRPSDALVWVTEANEPVFYSAGAVNKVVTVSSIEPLPSFMCSPPPFMENLCYAFGRIWGSVGSEVYYSHPYRLGWFKVTSNHYSFDSEVTIIAKVSTGLFVGTRKRTRFLAGTVPEKMEQSDAGAGSIKGTLAYCNNMPELGWTLGTAEKDYVDVPVWVTTEGVVVGGASGKFFNISKNKIKMSVPESGAALYRNLEGRIQYLTNFKSGSVGSGVGFRDDDTYDSFKSGHILSSAKSIRDMGSRTGFSDSATAEVRRGGIVI
jgi:hypothetical protein